MAVAVIAFSGIREVSACSSRVLRGETMMEALKRAIEKVEEVVRREEPGCRHFLLVCREEAILKSACRFPGCTTEIRRPKSHEEKRVKRARVLARTTARSGSDIEVPRIAIIESANSVSAGIA